MNTYTIKTEYGEQQLKDSLHGLAITLSQSRLSMPRSAELLESIANSLALLEEKPTTEVEAPTLRDQFAMAAIQGLLACPHGEGNLAIDAYYWADKMLVERAKGKAQS